MNEDKATRYHRLKRRVAVVSWLWGVVLLAGLLLSGLTLSLRGVAERLSSSLGGPLSRNPGAVVVLYVALLSLLNELVSLPLAFYSGFVLERRYELSNERLGRWLGDEAKSFGVALLLGSSGAALVYVLIRLSPNRWWLAAGPLFALIIVGLANLAPVILLPLFYRVKPLERESLRRRLLALAERAGARVLGTYEWGLADKTKKANAALTGLGRTRRILVSDTMLADTPMKRLRSCSPTSSHTTCTATSGRGSPSRARWSLPASTWQAECFRRSPAGSGCGACPTWPASRCSCSRLARSRSSWCRPLTRCRALSSEGPIASPST